MLDLSQILKDIHEMGAVTQARVQRAADQIAVARKVLDDYAEMWDLFKAEVASHTNLPWLVAGFGDEPIGTVFAPPQPPPPAHTVIATDGSQISLDRHAAAQCYLINTGLIEIHYGTPERPTLASHAQLYFRDEDLFPQESDDPSESALDMNIQTRRTLAESDQLAALIGGNSGRHACAMVDNPLIVWTDPGQTKAAIEALVAEFCKMLEAGRECHIPVIGYVSAPGHKDAVGALRSTLCQPGCGHGRKDPCSQLANLTDCDLFYNLLRRAGERSALFRSQARSAQSYPAEHEIWFFYMNAGTEIARVEVPAWVKNDPALLAQAHSLAFDQALKGQGYPVALAEAHNLAVVRGPERAAFFELIEQSFAHQRISVISTRKALAKRTPYV